MKLLLGVLAVFLVYTSAVGQLPSQDILALLEFKKEMKDDPTGFIRNSWNEESIDFNGCPSSWNGIVCNGDNVAGVVLDNLGLNATVDFSVFSNLTKLVKLSMANNSISGIISDSIGDLKGLQYLDVSNNLLFSTLPQSIGKLQSLKNLSLAGNNFSGPMPSSLTKLMNLVHLNLSLNGFVETIPKGFELITSLQVIDLHGNMLDGYLEMEFLLLSSAVYVDFSGNLLVNSGPGKQKFLQISETIKYLNLSRNSLSGSLINGGQPEEFQSLRVLDLSYNQLSGELPGFNFVYELEVLKLSNNRFSGLFPSDLLKGDPLVLTELDLSANNLSGSVTMISSTTLRIVDLSSNALSGELPMLAGSCAVLDLSKNQFEGNLSKTSKWANIERLDLSHNHLTGSIPDATWQFLRLNYLNLSHNSLGGPLPKSVLQYPKLCVLDLSNNQIESSLPTDLLTLPTLLVLHIENNLLSGIIDSSPPSSNKLSLRVLDLSHNGLDGFLPDWFGLLVQLQVLNLAGNNLSGSLPTSLADMKSLISLDLSQNNFSGPLPTNLTDGLQNVNISYNDLSGLVPEILRKFPSSSFYPGNTRLNFPNHPRSKNMPPRNQGSKSIKTLLKVVVIVACVLALFILVLLATFIYYIRISRRRMQLPVKNTDALKWPPSNPSAFGDRESGGPMVASAEDFATSQKGSSSEIISPEEKEGSIIGISPTKKSNVSSSPESGESLAARNLPRLDVRSPDQLVGELYFLDDTIMLTLEELSKAPAEVLGRSSHGTSYRATLDNGVFLTVKWLKEGVAKQRKEFAKEAKKFANIRHPNVVGLRGYYWGPTQHEKLILSDYISPGSLASFLYDRPGKRGPPLSWAQRLKIAVDIARGLNYLHFDRVVPHGNLKATNILLQGPDLIARVADYCLHCLMTQAGTVEQILDAGVLGYCAPELAASKKPVPSFKSDTYAFGVILMELLTGKCAGDLVSGEDGGVDLADWVRLKVADGCGLDCFDAALVPEMGFPAADKGMKEVLKIALRCIRPISERPGIKAVYEDLSSV